MEASNTHTATKITAEITQLPPFAPHSHSMVPGGFDVTS